MSDKPSAVRPPWQLLAPTPPLAGFVAAGFVTELALLAAARDGVFRHGFILAVTAALFLLTVWVGVGHAAAFLGRRVAGRGWRVAVGLAVATVVGGHLASWALFLQTGRFANLDSARFLWEHGQTSWMWHYLAGPERWRAAGVVALFLATAVAAPPLLRRAAGVRTARPAGRGFGRLLAAGTAALLIVAWLDRGFGHEARYDLLRNRLHPALTVAAGLVELVGEEGVEPCLDPAELRPLGGEPWRPTPRTGPAPSVLLVAVESLRPDVVHLRHQGVEVTPHLNRLAAGGRQFTRAYAQSTHSDYSDVCVLSSLYPLRTRRHHYYRADDPWPKVLLYDLLKPAGYATAVVSSQNEAWGGMDQFLASPHLDLLYDAERSAAPSRVSARDTGAAEAIRSGAIRAGSLDDAHTTDVAAAWLRDRPAGEPFLLQVNFQSSHFPYELAPGTPQPFEPCGIDADTSFLYYPPEKTPAVWNAYLNAAHECDRQLGRLVDTLRAAGRLENTVVVVYGENGEAFHENGTVTHAREPVEPGLRVACVLHAPGRLAPAADDYPVQLIDVAPTILGLLGQPPHPNFQGTDVLAAGRPPAADRLLFFHVETPLARADAVLHGGRWKFHRDRNTGRETLFDVLADPGEADDRTAADPVRATQLRSLLADWRRRQLAYYHYPAYHRGHYPPAAPSLPAAAR